MGRSGHHQAYAYLGIMAFDEGEVLYPFEEAHLDFLLRFVHFAGDTWWNGRCVHHFVRERSRHGNLDGNQKIIHLCSFIHLKNSCVGWVADEA